MSAHSRFMLQSSRRPASVEDTESDCSTKVADSTFDTSMEETHSNSLALVSSKRPFQKDQDTDVDSILGENEVEEKLFAKAFTTSETVSSKLANLKIALNTIFATAGEQPSTLQVDYFRQLLDSTSADILTLTSSQQQIASRLTTAHCTMQRLGNKLSELSSENSGLLSKLGGRLDEINRLKKNAESTKNELCTIRFQLEKQSAQCEMQQKLINELSGNLSEEKLRSSSLAKQLQDRAIVNPLPMNQGMLENVIGTSLERCFGKYSQSLVAGNYNHNTFAYFNQHLEHLKSSASEINQIYNIVTQLKTSLPKDFATITNVIKESSSNKLHISSESQLSRIQELENTLSSKSQELELLHRDYKKQLDDQAKSHHIQIVNVNKSLIQAISYRDHYKQQLDEKGPESAEINALKVKYVQHDKQITQLNEKLAKVSKERDNLKAELEKKKSQHQSQLDRKIAENKKLALIISQRDKAIDDLRKQSVAVRPQEKREVDEMKKYLREENTLRIAIQNKLNYTENVLRQLNNHNVKNDETYKAEFIRFNQEVSQLKKELGTQWKYRVELEMKLLDVTNQYNLAMSKNTGVSSIYNNKVLTPRQEPNSQAMQKRTLSGQKSNQVKRPKMSPITELKE